MEIEKGKWVISLRHQYQFYGCNWYDFTWIKLQTEWDKILGGVELDVGLIGINLFIRYQYEETEAYKDLIKMVDEWGDSE